MTDSIDHDRRRFLKGAAMAIGAAHVGMFSVAESEGASRELAAIGRAREWLNSPPLTPETLVGKVVLVQFCTYTCINWLRTLPYVRAWTEKYGRDLVVLGVHTPEFAFEHDVDTVRRALQRLKVTHPIAIDNDYAIWRAFDNHYWPALYFIDARGRVRDHHFGEGSYDQSERVIQRLLTGAGVVGVGNGVVPVDARGVEAQADWVDLRSRENYLGYDRTENFASPGGLARDRRRSYAAPERLGLNRWALAGEWTIGGQATVLAESNGRVLHRFHARDLHLVMGSASRSRPVRFRVAIDGRLPGSSHGGDVDEGGQGIAVEQRLYQLIRQPRPIIERHFEIEFLDAGVEIFAFTFG
jgi:thiol-disulfide isomerase/thioredoxin